MDKSLAPKRKPGRPSIYTEELGRAIADRYAAGEPLHVIAADPDMPCRDTIYTWRDGLEGARDSSFPDMLARARRLKGTWHAEEGRRQLHELSDDDLKQLGSVANAAVGMRDKRANYDKWLAGCLNGAYGDKLAITGELKVGILAAFVDMAPKPAGADVVGSADVLPRAHVPDGSE